MSGILQMPASGVLFLYQAKMLEDLQVEGEVGSIFLV